MVLQNKFKARASRRYNAARGGASDTRGRGGGGRGRGSYKGRDTSSFPSLNPDDDDEDDDEQSTEEGGDENPSSNHDKGKYSRRKLESNAWRYRQEEIDPHAEEEESEPEVDLSGLIARVAKLDSNRTTKALSSEKAAELASSSLQADVEDIDQSLIYLLDRQRERNKSSSTSCSTDHIGVNSTVGGLSAAEIKLLELEGKKLLEERENQRKHYGRAQMLKSQQSRVKSINIGDRRRAPDDKDQGRLKTKPKEKINLAALYDDDEQNSTDGGIDAFLQELDLGKDTAEAPSSKEVPLLKTEEIIALPTTAISSQRKEHEDFLDGII